MSWLVSTVTASTMIAQFQYGDKVRCHKLLVEIPGRDVLFPTLHVKTSTTEGTVENSVGLSDSCRCRQYL